jgi:hypothetical protein
MICSIAKYSIEIDRDGMRGFSGFSGPDSPPGSLSVFRQACGQEWALR